jgi:DDE superfamily endonuclease/Homeodomain-like domain
MPRTSPYSLTLTDAERTQLEARARRYTSPYSEVIRAKIVLYAAEGLGNDEIAARLDTPRQVVSKWRKRFFDERLAGLTDLPRGGRPPSFPPDVMVAIKALACEFPATADPPQPLARWQCPDLARAAVESGIVAAISGTTIWRWLSSDAIKPWQHRSWIFPRDPDFGPRAARVLDLYGRRFDDRPLRPDEYVISADEKTSIQARIRKHATTPPAPNQPARVEAEYLRGGSLAYLAAWDVHRAKVFGRCEATTGIDPFNRLIDQVMTTEPYASARRVFWVVDNGSSHRGQASIDRLQHRWPALRLIHLPVHASWLNQVEIYFSVVQRKVVSPNDFHTLDEVESRLLDFQQYYEQIATPFEWKFTKDDLNALLKRIADHENTTLTPAA